MIRPRFPGNYHTKRWFSRSSPCRDLFGGGKILNRSKYERLEAPSGKSETPSNPADLFKKNDILMFSNKPINYIEMVKKDGFHLSNSLYIKSPNSQGHIIGTLLLESETFEIDLGMPEIVTTSTSKAKSTTPEPIQKPQNSHYKIINGFMLEFNQEILDIFDRINPKPEILVIGTGKRSKMLSESNKRFLLGLGIQIEVGDSQNTAQVYDLLATERPNVVGGLLLPPNV